MLVRHFIPVFDNVASPADFQAKLITEFEVPGQIWREGDQAIVVAAPNLAARSGDVGVDFLRAPGDCRVCCNLYHQREIDVPWKQWTGRNLYRQVNFDWLFA